MFLPFYFYLFYFIITFSLNKLKRRLSGFDGTKTVLDRERFRKTKFHRPFWVPLRKMPITSLLLQFYTEGSLRLLTTVDFKNELLYVVICYIKTNIKMNILSPEFLKNKYQTNDHLVYLILDLDFLLIAYLQKKS